MAGIFVAIVFVGGFALFAAVFFFRRVYHYFQWREKASMPLWGRLLLMLSASILSLVVFGQSLLTAPQECPVLRNELKEVTASVDMVKERLTRRMAGRNVQTKKATRFIWKGMTNIYISPAISDLIRMPSSDGLDRMRSPFFMPALEAGLPSIKFSGKTKYFWTTPSLMNS